MWTTMPDGRHRLLTAAQMAPRTEQVRWFWLVPELTDLYADVQTLDRSELKGEDCYRLKVAKRKDIASVQDDRTIRYLYFSTSTGLPVGMETYPAGLERAGVTTLFGQWKEFQSPKLTLFTELKTGREDHGSRTTVFDEVTFNEVDNAVFAVPEQVVQLFEAEQAKAKAAQNEPPSGTTPAGVSGQDEAGEPASGEEDPELAQFTERERAQIKKALESFQRQTDPNQLRMIVGFLTGQVKAAQPGRDKAILEYVLKKLEERLEELESGG
jgi:hypothetical protein